MIEEYLALIAEHKTTILSVTAAIASLVGGTYRLIALITRSAKRQDTRSAKPKKEKKRRSDVGRRGKIKHAAFSKEKSRTRSEAPREKTFREKVGEAFPEGQTVPQPSPELKHNFTETSRTATEITAIENAAHKRLKQHQLDAMLKGGSQEEAAFLFGQQHVQQQGMLDQQMQAMQNQVNNVLGANAPLQGIPRDRPYWESMFGYLGKSGGPYYPRGGK